MHNIEEYKKKRMKIVVKRLKKGKRRMRVGDLATRQTRAKDSFSYSFSLPFAHFTIPASISILSRILSLTCAFFLNLAAVPRASVFIILYFWTYIYLSSPLTHPLLPLPSNHCPRPSSWLLPAATFRIPTPGELVFDSQWRKTFLNLN